MIVRLTPVERILHRFHRLPVPIMDAFGGVLFGRALSLAVRRGVFETLAHGPRTIPEVAQATRLNERALEILLPSLAATGYLAEDGIRYRLSPGSRRWLLKSSPAYLGNLILYFETLYERWGHLEYSLEHGQPPRRYFESFSNDDWGVYVDAMSDLARLLLPHVMKRISLPPSPASLLDLGGSHGLYTLQLCRDYPALRATIIDFPGALQHTHRFVRRDGMEDRVTLLPGDFSQIPLPGPQDAVLMFNIIHGFSREECRLIIGRALESLVPGGKIYVLDQLREEKRARGIAHLMPLLVGLNLLNEIGGSTYSPGDVQEWCSGARTIRTLRLPLPGISLIEVVR